MTKVDREALKRAFDIAMRDRAEQLKSKLEQDPWIEVARFAAYHCQNEALRLKPWEQPPMSATDRPFDRGARILLKRLLDAGLSRYEPDPMTALEKLRA